jgi:hypothetical protein
MVKKLYDDCLAASFGEAIEPEESHSVFCTLTAICLLYDLDKISFPLQFDPSDEHLLAEIMSSIDLIMTIENMADKNFLKRSVIDGVTYYSATEKELNAKYKPNK